ncbi:hypothetical protein [Aeoliella straminimaris]|nr:hypothetical protein [Aeoliella straminimaris]
MKTIAEQQGISVETVAMVALQKEVRTLQELVATVGDLVIAKL